ncbi:hypothetical protein MP228_007664 [Amoeboaphelidium protococcarum]|nr:hypothetical protein MP228_007664 [Amoeboaphelidium protococcarum]
MAYMIARSLIELEKVVFEFPCVRQPVLRIGVRDVQKETKLTEYPFTMNKSEDDFSIAIFQGSYNHDFYSSQDIDSHLLYVNHQAKRNSSTFCTNEEVALLSKAGLSTKDITEVVNTKLSQAGIQCQASYQRIDYKRKKLAPAGLQESPPDILIFLKQKQETCDWKIQLNTDDDQRLQSIFWMSPNMAQLLQQNGDVVVVGTTYNLNRLEQ